MVQSPDFTCTGSVQGVLQRLSRKVRLVDERPVGTATIRQSPNAREALDGAAETFLVPGDAIEPVRREVAHARPLVRAAEDAGDAAQPRPAQPVGRGRHDPVPPQHLPHRRLAQAVDRPPMVDVAAAAGATAGVGAIRLEGGVASPRPALLCALTGDDQRATIQEAVLVADQRRHDVDLAGRRSTSAG